MLTLQDFSFVFMLKSTVSSFETKNKNHHPPLERHRWSSLFRSAITSRKIQTQSLKTYHEETSAINEFCLRFVSSRGHSRAFPWQPAGKEEEGRGCKTDRFCFCCCTCILSGSSCRPDQATACCPGGGNLLSSSAFIQDVFVKWSSSKNSWSLKFFFYTSSKSCTSVIFTIFFKQIYSEKYLKMQCIVHVLKMLNLSTWTPLTVA